MGLRKNYQWRDWQLICDVCGKSFKTPQALASHQKTHDREVVAAEDTLTEEEAVPTPAAVRRAKAEVDLLDLERKKRAILRELNEGQRVAPDLAETAGFGKIQPDIASQLQARAFNVNQPTAESWLTTLMRSPESIKMVLDALKVALGLNQQSLATLAQELGYNNVKELFEATQGQRYSTGAMQVEGLVLPAECSESTFNRILDYKQAVDAAKVEADGRKVMGDSLQRLIDTLAPLVGEKLGHVVGRELKGGIARKPEGEPEPETIPCPNPDCDAYFDVSEAVPGERIACPKCGEEVEFLAEKPSRSKRRRVKPLEPELSEILCECGQTLAVPSDKGPGSEIRCPVCDRVHRLVSDVPIMAAEPPTQCE